MLYCPGKTGQISSQYCLSLLTQFKERLSEKEGQWFIHPSIPQRVIECLRVSQALFSTNCESCELWSPVEGESRKLGNQDGRLQNGYQHGSPQNGNQDGSPQNGNQHGNSIPQNGILLVTQQSTNWYWIGRNQKTRREVSCEMSLFLSL